MFFAIVNAVPYVVTTSFETSYFDHISTPQRNVLFQLALCITVTNTSYFRRVISSMFVHHSVYSGVFVAKTIKRVNYLCWHIRIIRPLVLDYKFSFGKTLKLSLRPKKNCMNYQ